MPTVDQVLNNPLYIAFHTQYRHMWNSLLLRAERAGIHFVKTPSKSGISARITCERRSPQSQAALYAKGRTRPGRIVTNANAWQSPHQYDLATDVMLYLNGKPCSKGSETPWGLWIPMVRFVGLTSGADFSSLKDYGHVEHPRWRLLARQFGVDV